jgi:single-stranded DNA-binding protein
MSDYSTRGLVATTPRFMVLQDGVALANFRLAEWVGEGDTENLNWFSVVVNGDLAYQVRHAVTKGDKILIQGDLIIREWEHAPGNSGTTAELTARTIGHDIGWAGKS